MESYVEKIIGAGQGQRKFFDPHIPSELKRSLVDALKAAHDELLTPPDAIKSNPQRLKEWKPRVPDDVNWEAVLNAGGEDLLSHRAQHSVAATQDAAADVPGAETDIPPFLTVGLIGEFGLVYPCRVCDFMFARTTECGQVVPFKRFIRSKKSQGIANAWKGVC